MLGSLVRLLFRCWGSACEARAGGGRGQAVEEGRDGLLWFRDLGVALAGSSQWQLCRRIRCWKTRARSTPGRSGPSPASTMVMAGLKRLATSVIISSGISEVSRSIGDAYMKHAQYNREPISEKFRISGPVSMPILTANPAIICHHLQPNDSFLIFASDGLWEHLSNETAVEIVHKHPRTESAKRLIKAALQEAARKREKRYSDLKGIDKNVRRHFHDDITVIVIFLNHDLLSKGFSQVSTLSVRGPPDLL